MSDTYRKLGKRASEFKWLRKKSVPAKQAKKYRDGKYHGGCPEGEYCNICGAGVKNRVREKKAVALRMISQQELLDNLKI